MSENQLTAKEALEKSIAAAERSQHSTNKLTRPQDTIALAQLAQAWAAIACEVRMQDWDHSVRTEWSRQDEGGDGGGEPTLEWALDRIADLSDQLTRCRDGRDGGYHAHSSLDYDQYRTWLTGEKQDRDGGDR